MNQQATVTNTTTAPIGQLATNRGLLKYILLSIINSFDASSYWLWGILGSLIIVGPFVYIHKLFHAMNLLSENYNIKG